MIYLVTTIHILVCFFIIVVVLLQSGKSGDISARRGQRAFESYDLVGCGIHDHFHHLVTLRFQARRPYLSVARSEVATCQDAARAGAKALDSAYTAEVESQFQ